MREVCFGDAVATEAPLLVSRVAVVYLFQAPR
jgi:hypothetical protein